MPTEFEDRLREASIQPPRSQIDSLLEAVDRIVAAKRPPAVRDLLVRVRLAHGLAVTDEQLDAFLAQLNRGETPVVGDRGHRQLIALLAACTLIGRFGKQDSLRATAAIPALTIAGLASRALWNSGVSAVHPDLGTSAGHWLDFQGQQLREAGSQSPPRPPGRLALAENEPVQDLQGKELQAIFDHAGEVHDWIESTAGSTGVAVLREQTSLLWWLSAGHLKVDPMTLGFQSALQLSEIALSPPPPARNELLRRRLGGLADVEVTPERFLDCRSDYPNLVGNAEAISDLLPLLSLGPRTAGPLLDITSALFEEIMLVRLIRSFLENEAKQAAEEGAAESDTEIEEGGVE